MNLVDLIELHIKSMLQKSKDNQILLRRNELAQHFGCAPSQINYVIQTRFNVERGYVIESQRGGGGFIRIIRVDVDEFGRALAALSRLGGRISQRQACSLGRHARVGRIGAGFGERDHAHACDKCLVCHVCLLEWQHFRTTVLRLL